MCYFYMGIVRRGAEGDPDALEHFSPRPNGHFLVLVVCAMSKNRWKNRSEKMLYGACLTEGGKDWGSLKPFGQCPYGNNTFQKRASLVQKLPPCFVCVIEVWTLAIYGTKTFQQKIHVLPVFVLRCGLIGTMLAKSTLFQGCWHKTRLTGVAVVGSAPDSAIVPKLDGGRQSPM